MNGDSEELKKRIEEIASKAGSGGFDVFNEFLNIVSRKLESMPRGETLITAKAPKRVEVICGSELDEFLKYCRDAEAVLGIDIRSLLSLIRSDMNYIKIEFKKNDVSVDITWWKYTYSRELNVTFKTPKITRYFLVFKEEQY